MLQYYCQITVFVGGVSIKKIIRELYLAIPLLLFIIISFILYVAIVLSYS